MSAGADLRSWAAIPDRSLARLELRQDLLAEHLTADAEERLAHEALALGAAAARRLRTEYPDLPPSRIAESLGILLSASGGESSFLEARAEYHPGSRPVIALNEPLIEETARALMQYFVVDGGLVRETAIAHELFHHLEETQLGLLSHQLEQVTLYRLGPWRLRRPIQRLREVGAHSFARHLVQLPYLPNLWDHLLLVERGSLSLEVLWQRLGL